MFYNAGILCLNSKRHTLPALVIILCSVEDLI